ncbi:hypothetical protein EJV47_27145 [Hymenobacter gummosus]|uniref:Uncharacterized protein n=1 Tax=Hymenobacter gummosus TaxID=1776032 RepID=A0A3S0H0K2_9BACT|nr:hypothetical protein [Hymenobacter gummosus]RTQ44884.1 hypothetical protein EJV47_27145 [Hymenobacter gummosus]
MNQTPTSPGPAGSAQSPTAPASPASPASPTALASVATRPALRVRYWEHMDPASRSLYPVD